MSIMQRIPYFFILFFLLSMVSCHKNQLLSNKHLEFSADTVVFDTVFTTVGSTTKRLKIYNRENKPLQIEEIELVGGTSSPFRINVDGLSGTKFSDMTIEKKDSLFVFVEVTLGINGETLPMIIEDSIRFRTNGVDQYVKLAVWGQDAYFHYKDLNEGTWNNDKPHVIYGYAAVDSAKTLIIPAGTNVHLHKNALLYVYKSTLKVEGTLNNEVVFQTDRLEQAYKDIPGQYYGIYFHQARPSTINYALIKNGISGVHLYSRDADFNEPTLTVTNTIFRNIARYGVFIYAGAKVKAENCQVSHCGTHALLVLEGGDFDFTHCDLLGYGGSSSPAVGISNYFDNGATQVTTVRDINVGKLTNCVLYGNLETELAIDTLLFGGAVVNLDFKNCLIKSKETYTDAFYQNTIWNQPPLFKDVPKYDFRFTENSPLLNNGTPTAVITDLFGNSRNLPPDIGAIEFQ